MEREARRTHRGRHAARAGLGVALVCLIGSASACSGEPSGPSHSSVGAASSRNPATTTSLTPSSAAAFVRLATGDTDEVPWADEVTWSIAGTEVGRFIPADDVAARLRGCPSGDTEFEGRQCPVSVLDIVRDAAGGSVVEKTVPEVVGCNHLRRPPVPAGLTPAVLRPAASSRNCFTDFAVTLWSDAGGRVSWVDLTLSGP